MNHHISSRPSGTDTTEPDETPQGQRRFTYQRGIALQTVIITVVMIAIAGAIAAVLFSSAQDATNELENASTSVNVWTARNAGQCQRSGGEWKSGAAKTTDLGALQAAISNLSGIIGWHADGDPVTSGTPEGYCKAKP